MLRHVLWRIAGAWSLTGLVGCYAVSLVSLFRQVPPVPKPIALIFAFMAFGSFVISVAAGFESRRQEAATGIESPRVVLGLPVPTWLSWWMVAVGLFLLASLALAITHLPGSPEVEGARYFFDDHGTHIPTTAMGYQQGLRRELQILTGVPGMFHLIALGYLNRLATGRRAVGAAIAHRSGSGYAPKSEARRHS